MCSRAPSSPAYSVGFGKRERVNALARYAKKTGAIITFTNPANVRNRFASSAPLVIRHHLPPSLTFPWLLPSSWRDPIDFQHHQLAPAEHVPVPNVQRYPATCTIERLSTPSAFFSIFAQAATNSFASVPKSLCRSLHRRPGCRICDQEIPHIDYSTSQFYFKGRRDRGGLGGGGGWIGVGGAVRVAFCIGDIVRCLFFFFFIWGGCLARLISAANTIDVS